MHTIRGVCARVCENTHAGVCLLITTKQWVTIWQQRALGNFPSCLIRNSGGPRASPHQLTLGPGWKITIIKQRCARERKSKKTRACDTQWGSRMEDGRALRMKETWWNKMRSCYSHLNVEKPWCSIDQGSLHYVWSSKDKSIIQFHFDENRSERWFSFLSFLRLYFSLSH